MERKDEMGFGDLLRSLLGGRKSTSDQESGLDDVFKDLLSSYMGQSGGQTNDLLGTLLGGQAERDSEIASNPMLAALIENLGLPPDVAQMVMGFAMNQLSGSGAQPGQVSQPSVVSQAPSQLQGMPHQQPSQAFAQKPPASPKPGVVHGTTGKKEIPRGKTPPNKPRGKPTKPAVAPPRQQVLRRLNTGQDVDQDLMKTTGLAQKLAEQSGLDHDTAARSLAEVYNLLKRQT
jgi:hypothetical protein